MIRVLPLLLAASLPALARPGWADKPDTADASGHVFTCEGQGATEEDALAAAQGICNDKICKVCGVEVESIVETRETLTGVDLSRKVVERCRRVRRADTKLRAKSVDCDPSGGCTAWISIFYSTDDQKQECTSYTKEDFTDPAACEADIQAFRSVDGRTAASFRARKAALDKALSHCAKIDVRPTPAILALDEKLRAGLEAFEWTEKMEEKVPDEWRRPKWSFWLPADPKLHAAIAESKLLIDRIRLARDLVADKVLLFDVIEAAQAQDYDTPAGVARLRAALEKAPPGHRYATKYDVHFSAVSAYYHAKTDTTPLSESIRAMFPPDKVEGGDDFTAAKLFADKGRVLQAEWDWQLAAHKTRACWHCLRTLLQVPNHVGDGTPRDLRLARAQQALPAGGERRALSQYTELIGYSNHELALDLEPVIPQALRAAYTWKFMQEFLHRTDYAKVQPELGARFARRAAEILASDPGDERNFCTGLAADVELLSKNGAPLQLLDGRTCKCLTGVLRDEVHLVNRDDLMKQAKERGLACIKGLRQE